MTYANRTEVSSDKSRTDTAPAELSAIRDEISEIIVRSGDELAANRHPRTVLRHVIDRLGEIRRQIDDFELASGPSS